MKKKPHYLIKLRQEKRTEIFIYNGMKHNIMHPWDNVPTELQQRIDIYDMLERKVRLDGKPE